METKIIDEQLEDKQQIVTYKYLTKKLNIHSNQAKQLLNDYASKLDGNKKYSTTKIIGGILKDNDEFCIVLVYDDHVETIRRRFKQINFEHLYSIQPISNRLSDINTSLYLVDNSPNDHAKLSSSIKKKYIEQNVVNKIGIDLPSNEETNSTNEVLNHINENNLNTKPVKTHEKNTELDIFAKIKKINSISNETLSNSSNNIKTKSEKSQKKEINLDSSVKNVNSNKKIEETKKDHSDFFTKFKKSNNSVNSTIAISTHKVLEENIKENNKKVDTQYPLTNVQEYSINEHQIINNNIDKECPKSNVKQNLINKHKEKNEKKSNKKKEYKNKNDQKSKRKRIQTFDSSDEEEIDAEEEDKKRSEHNMDIDDEIDFVQPTPPRPTPRENRRKEKQVTTSTFIDDDGFVCTTKEVQFVEIESQHSTETVVENVENSKPKEINIDLANKKIKLDTAGMQVDKKKNKLVKQSKNISSQGMKQSSLTSFFKTK